MSKKWITCHLMLFFFFFEKKFTRKACWYLQVCPWGRVTWGDGKWRKQLLKKRTFQIEGNLDEQKHYRKAATKAVFHACIIPGLLQPPQSYFIKRQVQWLILCHILNELMHIPQFTQVIRWQMFYLAWNIKYSLSHSMVYSFIHSFIHSQNKHVLSIQSVPGTVFSLGTRHQVKPASRCCLEWHDIK